MNLADIPLFSMLRGRLGYLSERQKVIAQNVANADTARYVAQDLKAYSFEAKVQMARQAQGPSTMAATQAGHMTPKNERRGPAAQFKPVRSPGSETTLNGNSVVLEEEMIRMTETRASYEAALSFYEKSRNLLRMASRPPGRA